jgi:hypothetical protein
MDFTKKHSRAVKLLFTAILSAIVWCAVPAVLHAQQETDTDPNRWLNVKSWQGSYSLTCKDSDSLQEGDTTTIVTHTTDISGIYEVSWSSATGPYRYSWQGKGNGHGTVNEVLQTIEDDFNCTVVTTVDASIPPLVMNDPGYYLDWFPQGVGMLPANSYWLETGALTLPGTFTPCVGGTISQDWELGGGASGYVTLPAAGYHLTGSREFEFGLQAPFRLTYIFSWDLEPKEFKPASCPLAATIKDAKALAALRGMRGLLEKKSAGMALADCYYQHAAEVTAILSQDPELQAMLKELVRDNIAAAHNLLAGRAALISSSEIDKAQLFLSGIYAQAGPELRQTLELVMSGIDDGSLLRETGLWRE